MNRCFLLNDFLRNHAFETCEIFPLATRKILFPAVTGRKQKRVFREKLMEEMNQRGIHLSALKYLPSHDELDALLGALTVLLCDAGRAESIGDPLDGFIIIPREENHRVSS